MLIGERVVNNVAPRASDVAMVFQSYALYPHMTVYNNLAFGLRNLKVPPKEIERARAARRRDARPRRRCSSGSRSSSRAASASASRSGARSSASPRRSSWTSRSRTWTRSSASQTRAEILKLQRRLGTTTVYVTHDQVEAMTMGDRIAVMNFGVLQQVGSPQELYSEPTNVFVAGFIGSPAMNLVPAPLVGAGGSNLIAGFRPEHLDARTAPAVGDQLRRAASR